MSSFSTPTAIFLGLTVVGALSGAGLYFGLRARPATPAETSTTAPRAPTTTAPPAPPPDAPAPAVALSNAQAPSGASRTAAGSARDEILRGFDAQRAKVVKECWEPEVAQHPDPPTMKIHFDMTYGANGQVLARGMVEAPDHPHPAVPGCVQRVLETPTITPTGAQLRLRVPFTLP